MYLLTQNIVSFLRERPRAPANYDLNLDLFASFFLFQATDNHLGFMAKDPERGRDSLVTFEEILQIAQEKKAIILLYIDSTIFIRYTSNSC